MAPLSERLQRVQAEARQFRCEAFVRYSPVVCGEPINPITLDSYNALCAFGSAFVTGEAPSFDDIVNFIWLHHPRFGQFNRREKRDVTRRVWSHLNPMLDSVTVGARFLARLPATRWLRHFRRKTQAERVSDAIAEIRRLIVEATRDIPTGGDESADGPKGEPLPFAYQAWVLNLFRRELGMPFEETSRLPLKQLAEHLRELLHHTSRGKALLLTKEEAEIWREHLGREVEGKPVAGTA